MARTYDPIAGYRVSPFHQVVLGGSTGHPQFTFEYYVAVLSTLRRGFSTCHGSGNTDLPAHCETVLAQKPNATYHQSPESELTRKAPRPLNTMAVLGTCL